MTKFTFRKQSPETGLSAVANPYPSTTIKLNGKMVGEISAPSRFGHDSWRVRFVIDDLASDWRWVTLKAKFNTEPEARKFLSENATALIHKIALHPIEED